MAEIKQSSPADLAHVPLHVPHSDIGDLLLPIVYWHRQLPPVEAEVMGEHTMEATSHRVPGTLAHRDDLWDQCYRDLMDHTRLRLEQEIVRLGGDYAHVMREAVEPRHDEAKGEAWLHGRFTYALYRRLGARTGSGR